MTARDVHEVILTRLPALGSPGDRFFFDPDVDPELARELIAREYVEALQQFDRETLERAFARVRDTNTTGFWPAPGKFRLAALALTPPTADADAPKRCEAEKRAEAYVARYRRSSSLYRQAKRDGWAGELINYVHAAALLQAQVIAGTDGVSWDAVLTDPRSSTPPQQQIEAMVAECRRKELKEIKVTVPKSRIAHWRSVAAHHPPSTEPTEWQELVSKLTQQRKSPHSPT